MSENLTTIVGRLNSAEKLSISLLLAELKNNPNTELIGTVQGHTVAGNQIAYQDLIKEYFDIAGMQFHEFANTTSWQFTLGHFDFTNTTIFHILPNSGQYTEGLATIITGEISAHGIVVPVVALAVEDSLLVLSVPDLFPSSSVNETSIESLLNIPSLIEKYPAQAKVLTPMYFTGITLTLDLSDDLFVHYSIESKHPAWSINNSFVVNNCVLECNVPLPIEKYSSIFNLQGHLYINQNTEVLVDIGLPSNERPDTTLMMIDDTRNVPSLNDIATLLLGTDVVSKFPGSMGVLENLLLTQIIYTFTGEFSEVSGFHVQLEYPQSGSLWNIIPGTLSLNNMALGFSYEPLSCLISGQFSLNTNLLNLQTRLYLDSESTPQELYFELDRANQTDSSFTPADLSLWGVSVFDKIPYFKDFAFNLENLSFTVELSPQVQFTTLSLEILSGHSWTILGSHELSNLSFTLNYLRKGSLEFDSGEFEAWLTVGSDSFLTKIYIPSEGDWQLYFMQSPDDYDAEGYPLPSLSSLDTLLGTDLIGKLPSMFIFDNITLRNMILMFPGPLEPTINTAMLEFGITSELPIGPLCTLSDIVCTMYLNFINPDQPSTYSFSALAAFGSITAHVDLEKTGDNWSISLRSNSDFSALNLIDEITGVPVASTLSVVPVLGTALSFELRELNFDFKLDPYQFEHMELIVGLPEDTTFTLPPGIVNELDHISTGRVPSYSYYTQEIAA